MGINSTETVLFPIIPTKKDRAENSSIPGACAEIQAKHPATQPKRRHAGGLAWRACTVVGNAKVRRRWEAPATLRGEEFSMGMHRHRVARLQGTGRVYSLGYHVDPASVVSAPIILCAKGCRLALLCPVVPQR